MFSSTSSSFLFILTTFTIAFIVTLHHHNHLLAVHSFILERYTGSAEFTFSSLGDRFNYYQHDGFRGLPFFRFGLPSCSSSSSSRQHQQQEQQGDHVCAILDINLKFRGLTMKQRGVREFAQVVIHRVEDEEELARLGSDQNKNHVCNNHGQLYGAAVLMRNNNNNVGADGGLQSASLHFPFYVVDSGASSSSSSSSDDGDSTDVPSSDGATTTIVRSKVPLNQEGLYIVYINSCSNDDEILVDEVEVEEEEDVTSHRKRNPSTSSSSEMNKRMWSNNASIIDLGYPSAASPRSTSFIDLVTSDSLDSSSSSYIALYTVSSSLSSGTVKVSFLPPQLSSLVPSFIAFTIIDLILLLALAIGSILVGASRILKYQIALVAAIICDLVSSGCVLLSLRAFQDYPAYSSLSPNNLQGGGLAWDALLVSVAFDSARDAVLRSFIVFLFFGVGMTRPKFPPETSGIIIISAIIYGLVRSYVNRDRLKQELSVNFGGISDQQLQQQDFRTFHLSIGEILVGIVFEIILITLLVLYAARKTFTQLKQASTRRNSGKLSIFTKTLAVVCFYSICALAWMITSQAMFYNSSSSSSGSSSSGAAERNWRMWWLIEFVPKAMIQSCLILVTIIWFPSKDSHFYVMLQSGMEDDDNDEQLDDENIEEENQQQQCNNTENKQDECDESSSKRNILIRSTINQQEQERRRRRARLILLNNKSATSDLSVNNDNNRTSGENANQHQQSVNSTKEDDETEDDDTILDFDALNQPHDSVSRMQQQHHHQQNSQLRKYGFV